MSSPTCSYDNAAMGNFFGALKTEYLYRACFSSRAEVEQLVAEYIQSSPLDEERSNSLQAVLLRLNASILKQYREMRPFETILKYYYRLYQSRKFFFFI